MDADQLKRVRAELKAVGVGIIGLHTPESKEIARTLYPNEHIGGVVYGRYDNGLAWIVATDQRVIFIDKKPMFATSDELTYDVVAGVKYNKAGPSTAVTLHTRVADYSLRNVPAKCAAIFVKYIEDHRLRTAVPDPTQATNDESPPQPFDEEGLNFLKEHDLAVLSTVDRTGNVHGAVVYYVTDDKHNIFIQTKSETGKGRNIYAHSQVALTIHQPGTLQTLQLQGMAQVETDQQVKDKVFAQIVRPRPSNGKMEMPPITKLDKGAFMVIRITPTIISYRDYSKIER